MSSSNAVAGPSNGTSETISVKSSAPSGPPPSYSKHQNDELLLSNVNLASRRRAAVAPRSPRLRADPSPVLQVLAAPRELTLTLDNGLIYPPPPSNALYYLPRVLSWSGNEIFLFRSLPGSTTSQNLLPPRELALYTMRRTLFTHEVALMPRREGLKAAVMRGRWSFFDGMVWNIEVKSQVILRYAKGKWKNTRGQIVAEESQETGHGAVLTIVGTDLEVNMKDLIVASWTTRLWQSPGRASLTRTLLQNLSGSKASRTATLMRWRTFRDG
ncbi:uncharacterized protein PV09_08460 [Verruconis gallopava]|uniref:Uncharacterized protein n=1 Tax=Verruconis gallopava TaxID=253628 RepID=A0A0D2ALI8_9PEZI|nr:uncharacterized protein PV09_08460 [Verruconis gallopava]KIV99943.1 hypothetical protein PV09_08460 [Verruconis gallopava]